MTQTTFPRTAGPWRLSEQVAGRLAWTCAVLALTLAAAALGIAIWGALTTGNYRAILSHQTLTPFITVGFALIGALVAAGRPRHPIGWIFTAVGLLFALTALAAAVFVYGSAASPIYPAAVWLGSWLWLPAIFLPMTFVLLLFPDGHLPSRRWAFVGWSAALGLALLVIAVMLYPGGLPGMGLPVNPLGVPGAAPVLDGLLKVSTVLLAVGFFGCLASFLLRFRGSAGIERQQMKWLAYALGFNLLTTVAGWVAGSIWPEGSLKTEIGIALSDLGTLAIAVAATIGILRHRLFDIDLVINRTLVYGLLTAGIVCLYVGAVNGFGALAHSDQPLAPLLLATVVVLLAMRPAYAILRRVIDRLVPGRAQLAAAPMTPVLAAADGLAAPRPFEQRSGLATVSNGPAADTPAAAIHADPELEPASPERAPGRLAWALFLLPAALTAAAAGPALWILARTGSLDGLAMYMWGPVLTLTYALVGALVTARQPRHPIGWICSAVGVFSAANTLGAGYRMASAADLLLPGAQFVYWLSLWVWIPEVLLPLTFLLLLFPDGRLPSRRWRLLAWAAGLAIATYTLADALHPSPAFEPAATTNPYGIPGASGVLDGVVTVATILVAVGALGSVTSVVMRFRRSRGVERAQMKWLAYAGVVGLLVNLAINAWAATQPAGGIAFDLTLIAINAMLCAIAAAVGIAILRHRLYDIDLVINRTLVYGALTVFVAGLYVLVVGASGEVLHQTGSLVLSLLVTGLIAILFQPLRERLQRAVNRLLYGERDEPYAVLSRLGQRLEAALAPEAVLPALVETIGQALKLPYVAVALQAPDGQGAPEIAAAYGRAVAQPLRLPLSFQLEAVGELCVAPRGPGETFMQAEQRLLVEIARQAGVAAHAVRLTADLQRSRERLVTAREEERRRIRRDLHDGLGPTLASQSYHLDAALDLVDQDPAAAKRLIADLKVQTQTTLADIRRLVYELRPPALDELGLVAALQGLFSDPRDGLQVRVEASPATLPPLSAAVEVAAYRIAAEAVTNVGRHANAQHCQVRLSATKSELTVEVCDDGRGLPGDARPGVGLASMRERAAELGGACTVQPNAGGGTRVLARLPLHTPVPAP